MCRRGRPRGQGRPRGLHLWSGLGKIDCNRYSIAIFLTFFQSNTPDPLLFGMSIEYAVFFSFFQVKTIFDFFFFQSSQIAAKRKKFAIQFNVSKLISGE